MKNNNLETRNIDISSFEVRQDDNGDMFIEGYASVFDSRSKNLGGFYEYIDRSAFENTDMSNTVALINHSNDYVLGRSPQTLQLEVDERGLKYRLQLGNQSYARDLYESIQRGDINSSSFAFTIAKGGDTWEKRDGEVIRTISSIDTLYDVSPVTTPAYASASVSARSLEQAESLTDKKEEVKEVTPKSYYQKLKLRLLKKKNK
jgi:HK97 family phage prohead protease